MICSKDFREQQLNETETNFAESRSQCKQQADQIQEHKEMISKLNSQIDKLKASNSEEVGGLNTVIREKMAAINDLEHEVEKCRESISCKSIEIAKLNDSNEESNKSIKCLETTINNLNEEIERLKQLHSDEINNKVKQFP